MSQRRLFDSSLPVLVAYKQTFSHRFLSLLLFVIISLMAVWLFSPGASLILADSERAGAEYELYLPLVMYRYPADISGRVTFNRQAATGIELSLNISDGNGWSPISTTKTDNRGFYQFEDAAALKKGQSYYVRFGPNESMPQYVYSWYGPIIDEFTPGDSVSGGYFDIADVPLISPASGEEVTLPATFMWSKRDFAVEDYRVVLLDPASSNSWDTNFLRDRTSVTIIALPSGAQFGQQYAWYVEVFSEVDSFGESFSLNDIKFKKASALGQFAPVGGFSSIEAGPPSRRNSR